MSAEQTEIELYLHGRSSSVVGRRCVMPSDSNFIYETTTNGIDSRLRGTAPFLDDSLNPTHALTLSATSFTLPRPATLNHVPCPIDQTRFV